ncbi:MAG: FAD-dependent oxidoreductase [Tissierellia bacterium]|nr:FAD-dependent oxidoreductase [Tissierellia bacterium]
MSIEDLKFYNPLPESYWMASTEQTQYPSLDQDIKVDVVIVGGGMAGICTAYELSKENLKVALLESGRIIEATSGYTTAKVTSQHGLIYNKLIKQVGRELAQQYATANEEAILKIKRIADENGIDADYSPQNAFIYTKEDQYINQIEEEVEAASCLGIKASFMEEIPLSFGVKAAVKFENQAQFHPRRFLLPLAKIAEKKGVKIYEHTRAIELLEENNKYTITTLQGKKVTAQRVVIASHFPFYNKPGKYYARIFTERSYVLGIHAKEKYPGGMYISAGGPGRSLRAQDTDNGELILVVGDNHKTGQGEDTLKHFEALLGFAKNNFTLIDVPYRWSTQDCVTLDGIPYVGHYSADTPNLYLATGFGKWGMTNSIVSSEILRDLIIKGENPWQEIYNPSRKTLVHSAKNLILQGVDFATELIGGKLSKTPKEVELELDQAQIIEVDDKRAGAYRDKSGKLHIVNTTCTHLGCELNWNSAEKSWDCPCHGSRFDYEGKVIEGPATQDLSFGEDVNVFEKLFKENF